MIKYSINESLLRFGQIVPPFSETKVESCAIMYNVMYVKYPQLFLVRVGHRVPAAAFCLSIYNLCVLNRGVNMIKQRIYSVDIVNL